MVLLLLLFHCSVSSVFCDCLFRLRLITATWSFKRMELTWTNASLSQNTFVSMIRNHNPWKLAPSWHNPSKNHEKQHQGLGTNFPSKRVASYYTKLNISNTPQIIPYWLRFHDNHLILTVLWDISTRNHFQPTTSRKPDSAFWEIDWCRHQIPDRGTDNLKLLFVSEVGWVVLTNWDLISKMWEQITRWKNTIQAGVYVSKFPNPRKNRIEHG